MKKLLLIALLFTATNLFGQGALNIDPISGRLPGVMGIDTNLRVQYVDRTTPQKLPLFYLNGRRVNAEVMQSVPPGLIDSIAVQKDSIKIDNVMYYGQIHLRTKAPYSQQLITLGELKAKYTNLKNEPAIFIFDGKIINFSPETYVIDESRLWRIIIDKIEDKGINLKTINILTKTEQNMKKADAIMIRSNYISNAE